MVATTSRPPRFANRQDVFPEATDHDQFDAIRTAEAVAAVEASGKIWFIRAPDHSHCLHGVLRSLCPVLPYCHRGEMVTRDLHLSVD